MLETRFKENTATVTVAHTDLSHRAAAQVERVNNERQWRLYERHRLPVPAQTVLDTYDRLPLDPYMAAGDTFRRRRYGSGAWVGGRLSWQAGDLTFHQSTDLNTYTGGIHRRYAPLETGFVAWLADVLLPTSLLPRLPTADYDIGVHQIRCTCDDTMTGHPAPEGVHQDGFDYVATFCLSSVNISGGISVLVMNETRNYTVYEGMLEGGDGVIFNDRLCAHYVSPITPKVPGVARRDMVVLTFKKKS